MYQRWTSGKGGEYSGGNFPALSGQNMAAPQPGSSENNVPVYFYSNKDSFLTVMPFLNRGMHKIQFNFEAMASSANTGSLALNSQTIQSCIVDAAGNVVLGLSPNSTGGKNLYFYVRTGDIEAAETTR